MRKFISFLLPAAVAAMGTVLIVATTSCRKNISVSSAPHGAEALPDLSRDALSRLPGPVYATQASSPISWQPWTPETFTLAKKMNRLVLAVVVTPQQSFYQQVLNDLSGNEEIVDSINQNYVPVLVDADAVREMQIIAGDLCLQIKKKAAFPLFLWLSPEGNPVSWLPIGGKTAEGNIHTFKSIEDVISDMTSSRDGYIERNSAKDQQMRRSRILKGNVPAAVESAPEVQAVAALRQLLSLYDIGSRSLDNAGSLIPSSVIDTLASASLLPGIPKEIRQRSKQTTAYLLEDFLASAIFDPLDEGVFSAYQDRSGSMPFFERNTITQARVAVALFHAYAATSDPLARERALGCIGFAEKGALTPEGLFTYGYSSSVPTESWLWKTEDLERLLGPQDAAWWGDLTGMKSMGNIPMGVDDKRNYFRMNLQALKKPLAVMAKESDLSEQEFYQKFTKIQQTLLAERGRRQGVPYKDKEAHAGASFRMISAYAAAYTATGDRQFLEKATQLFERAKAAFEVEGRLHLYAGDYVPSLTEGRAFLYGLAMQAALDVADISGDQKPAKWGEELAATISRLFTEEGFVREYPLAANVMDLPVADRLMLFDDSTAGLLSEGTRRLQGRGLKVPASLVAGVVRFPREAVSQPILHSDLIIATLSRSFSPTVVLGSHVSPELADAVRKLPLRLVNRRPASPGDEVSPENGKLLPGTGDAIQISSPEAVREALLPSL